MKEALIADYVYGDEASKYLRITERKLSLYRRYGMLKYSRLGKNYVYRKQWLDDFMEEWSCTDLSNEEKIRLAINGRKWMDKQKTEEPVRHNRKRRSI